MKKLFILPTIIICFLQITLYSQNKSGFITLPHKESNLRQVFESLIGEGIVLKNFSVTRQASPTSFARFEDSRTTLGMKKGLLLTSGCALDLPAVNTKTAYSCNYSSGLIKENEETINLNSYPELSRILKGNPPNYDACVIELDIVPTSDTLSFNYVFGSEEYDKYVGSEFNDAFAFFISGKGIDGEKNLAVLPGTDVPVSINTINGGNSEAPDYKSSNASYYVSNKNGQVAMEYNGFTRLMEIRQPVIAYETYHIKLAIADVDDDALDSGVFIEGQSFISYDKSYNVLFGSNSSVLDDGYKTMLKDLANSFKNKAGGKGILKITGHTDSDGTPELNDLLSEQRAKEVFWFLKSLGIPEANLVLSFKGENMPRADNFAELGKQLNRRVEIKFCGSISNYLSTKTAEYNSNTNQTTALKDAYPNPFTTSGNLRAFILPQTKNATLTLQDIKGTLIKTIQILERGNTETYVDGYDLTNGVYIATLYADGVNAGSIKLVLQK